MQHAKAIIQTECASSYLRKLCQHWSHRFEVEFDDAKGSITLPLALCTLDASSAELIVRLAIQDEADPEKMKRVVEEHLQRFAFKEALQVDWLDAAEANA